EKRGLYHQDVGVASVFGQPVGSFGIAHDDELLAPLWRPEDFLGIDHPTVRERHRPSFRQLLAHWAVRHSEGFEAVRPKMTADLAFQGKSEAVGVAVADRKAADRELASVEDLTFRQGHELQRASPSSFAQQAREHPNDESRVPGLPWIVITSVLCRSRKVENRPGMPSTWSKGPW